MNPQLSPSKEILQKSWKTFKDNANLIIGVFLSYLFIYLSVAFVASQIIKSMPFYIVTILINILVFFFNLLLTLGVIKIIFQLSQNHHTEIWDIFKNGHHLIQFIAAHILYGFIVTIGIILLIIPGIIWAIQFCFFPLLIIDKNLNPVEALKASSRLTQGYKWQLLNFFLILFMINAVGFILIGIGLLATIPISLLAYTSLYRELSRS
jgi:uncharacterized membrane protein